MLADVMEGKPYSVYVTDDGVYGIAPSGALSEGLLDGTYLARTDQVLDRWCEANGPNSELDKLGAYLDGSLPTTCSHYLLLDYWTKSAATSVALGVLGLAVDRATDLDLACLASPDIDLRQALSSFDALLSVAKDHDFSGVFTTSRGEKYRMVFEPQMIYLEDGSAREVASDRVMINVRIAMTGSITSLNADNTAGFPALYVAPIYASDSFACAAYHYNDHYYPPLRKIGADGVPMDIPVCAPFIAESTPKWGPGTLAPGETQSFSFDVIVRQDDVATADLTKFAAAIADPIVYVAVAGPPDNAHKCFLHSSSDYGEGADPKYPVFATSDDIGCF